MSTGYNIPWFLLNFGPSCANGFLYTYIADSDQVNKPTYSDYALTTARANPIRLDGNGIAPETFFESGGYYFVVRDVAGNEMYSRDNVFPGSGGGVAVDDHMVSLDAADVAGYLLAKFISTPSVTAQEVPGSSPRAMGGYVNESWLLKWLNQNDFGKVQSDWSVTDETSYAFILNKPDIFQVSVDGTDPGGYLSSKVGSADASIILTVADGKLNFAVDYSKIPNEPGGKVKIDSVDSTADYLSAKLVADTDPKGKQTIVFTKHGSDSTNKTYGAMVDVNNVYDEIVDKMNPPAYDLFGAYPDEVGVCQLTGIGAALRSKSLKNSAGNAIAWTAGIGQNGAIYGRSCVPGYAYLKNATGTQVHKRIWCAFGSLGQIESSFDRYQSVTHDTSLETVDAGNHYFQYNSGLSCAAYIKNGTSHYWFVGGFVDNKIYALEDIAANYNDDGTFKSTAWSWIDCAGLPTDTAHICSVESGGFLFTGYHLGGINYKDSIAAASSRAINNLPRINADYVTTITANGYSYSYPIQLPTGLYYGGVTGSASDSSGALGATYTQSGQTNVTVNVIFDTLLADGDVVTVTIHSYLYDQNYSGAGFSGVGSDHYGTYSAIDRDTGRIYSNISEVTGAFDPTAWTSTLIYVRNSDANAYSATKVDRLGSTYGSQLPADPYTWWSSIQSAYGLWVATVGLKQGTSDPIYAYSDDGVHWTKYTNGVGVGTSGVLAIWDSQSDGMNWYVTSMYDATPLISQLLVNSIPAHKRLVCERGLGVSGDAFLVDLPNAAILSTDENGKIMPGTGGTIGARTNLDDLKNVNTANKTDGQLLYWDLASDKWMPKTVINDHLVLATTQDTTPGVLGTKLAAGTNIGFTVTTDSHGDKLWISARSNMLLNPTYVQTDYTVVDTDTLVTYNGTATSVTITLPPAGQTYNGRGIYISSTASNATVTLSGTMAGDSGYFTGIGQRQIRCMKMPDSSWAWIVRAN